VSVPSSGAISLSLASRAVCVIVCSFVVVS